MKLAGEISLDQGAGSIDVQQLIAQAIEREHFAARQQRNLEWIALKAWWAASRRLRLAEQSGKRSQIESAKHDAERVNEVYGAVLTMARQKWEHAREELRRRGYQRLG